MQIRYQKARANAGIIRKKQSERERNFRFFGLYRTVGLNGVAIVFHVLLMKFVIMFTYRVIFVFQNKFISFLMLF